MGEPFGGWKRFQISLKFAILPKYLRLSHSPHVRQGQGSTSVPGHQHARGTGQQPDAPLQNPVSPTPTRSVGDTTSSYHSSCLFIYFLFFGPPENGIFKDQAQSQAGLTHSTT